MRAPDLNAPRFRYKFNAVLSTALIKKFKEKYPQYAGYSDKVLINAIKEHNKLMAREVYSSRDGIELPAGMGTVFVGTFPLRKRKSIAYKQSIALGMKVYHKNWETDNKLFKIFYTNFATKYKFEGRHLWYFTAVRQLKRSVAAECPKEWRKFVSLDCYKNIWDLFEKRRTRDMAREFGKKALETYSEFDI